MFMYNKNQLKSLRCMSRHAFISLCILIKIYCLLNISENPGTNTKYTGYARQVWVFFLVQMQCHALTKKLRI